MTAAPAQHRSPVTRGPAATPPSAPPPTAPTRPAAPPPPDFTAGRDWRSRLPELVAGTGLAFVAAAMIGFVSSTWADLGDGGKALLLLAATGGLSAAAAMADDRGPGLSRLGNVVWAAGSVTLASAVVIGVGATAPDLSRLGLAAAGLAGLLHVGVRLVERTDAWVLLATAVGLGVLAAGPPGTALSDGLEALELADVVYPLAGLLDVTLSSTQYSLTGPLHAVLGLVALAAARRLPAVTATTAKLAGTALLWYSAAELNVMTAEIGAVLALLIVLGHLAHGLVADDTLLVVLGTLGALLAGTRVLTALFSGEVVVTMAVFGAGIGMLVWAWQAVQRRSDDGVTSPDAVMRDTAA